MTGDGHRHVNRLNGLITVNHIKAHQVLVVQIAEVFNVKTHSGRTNICSSSCSVTAELDIARQIKINIRSSIFMVSFNTCHLITRNGMRRSVVIGGIRITCNIHNHNTCRYNLQPTVSDIEGNIEVVVIIGELTLVQTHVVNTHCSTRSNCTAIECNIRGVVVSIGRIDRITRNC